MTTISEKDMESQIEKDLIKTGYFKRNSEKHYSKTTCVDKDQLINFLIATQKERWDAYAKHHGAGAEDALINRIKDFIDKHGTLELLRKPLGIYGVYFDLAYFKPASGLNAEDKVRYEGNILSVMRQVKYSEKNENSLDMVVLLNGLPLITLELKDKMTASGYTVNDAIEQYQKDRDPKEPLFRFKRCLVHFAVDEDNVYMSTELKGLATWFLPFNKGNKNQAGNPSTAGFPVEYLWKEIFLRDSLLEIIQYFIQTAPVLDEDGRETGGEILIFPRYQQLDAVRQLLKDAKKNGAGKNYLIQHSAGSGKSNTISWLVHQLASAHDGADQVVFDSTIVVTDRRILDSQLRNTIKSFQHVSGLVVGVEDGSKQLKEELESGTKIIITTLQKFPRIEKQIKMLPGKRFAIILDEAHSSSSGEMSKSLKKVLNLNAEDDAEEKEEETWEDKIEEDIKARGKQKNVSYFAFTATPKPKTLELFGVKQKDGSFKPFHLYSMRQAIQEKFIKDVLPNYITYTTYFELIKKVAADPAYDKAKASRLLKVFVELAPQTIEKKTEIIITHFMEHCAAEMNGQAKAMMVCSSRAQAVKYKLAFDKYLQANKLPYQALVAFSGSIEDGSGTDYTEARLNGFPESQTAKVFRDKKYKFLICANKFQTGYDMPLLYAMYVNKKLHGVNAVQTVSRLNRIFKDKKDPITMDFINPPKVIQKAFQDFYEEVELENETDPNRLYDLKKGLDDAGYYTLADVDEFNRILHTGSCTQSQLVPVLNRIVDKFKADKDQKHRDLFRSTMKAYLRLYSFLVQIVSFPVKDLHKLYLLCRILYRKLPHDSVPLPIEVLQQADLNSLKIKKINTGLTVKPGEGGVFKPEEDRVYVKPQEVLEPLSIIIKWINEHFGTNFTEADKEVVAIIISRLSGDAEFEEEVANNPEGSVLHVFEKRFNGLLQEMIETQFDFYKKLNNNSEAKEDLMKRMFKVLYEKLKKRDGARP
ncbi:MAG: hypothetical protein A2270_10450 [Elusimicrobia bacterium RIFOXYA12_FULL_51_18]|nr:MAG: hypothetical protein A2270_10450 [Elusimicrobia bacterium RIFOXYA12_FULL_51_18]OGS29516.1 MAG: hypothetical protein A2218_00740 [Elusimicrobia bacterium RIFOXYA2_FULL_53_38]